MLSSDGFLLYRFNRCLDKNQSLSAPNDVRLIQISNPCPSPPQAHESNLLGQERILARAEETREINMAMAEHRGGSQGNQARAA